MLEGEEVVWRATMSLTLTRAPASAAPRRVQRSCSSGGSWSATSHFSSSSTIHCKYRQQGRLRTTHQLHPLLQRQHCCFVLDAIARGDFVNEARGTNAVVNSCLRERQAVTTAAQGGASETRPHCWAGC
jgi:hypothetical protein